MSNARQARSSRAEPSDVFEAWRMKVAKAMGQPYLVALMIGSMLLSAASFFTTFDGTTFYAGSHGIVPTIEIAKQGNNTQHFNNFSFVPVFMEPL